VICREVGSVLVRANGSEKKVMLPYEHSKAVRCLTEPGEGAEAKAKIGEKRHDENDTLEVRRRHRSPRVRLDSKAPLEAE